MSPEFGFIVLICFVDTVNCYLEKSFDTFTEVNVSQISTFNDDLIVVFGL